MASNPQSTDLSPPAGSPDALRRAEEVFFGVTEAPVGEGGEVTAVAPGAVGALGGAPGGDRDPESGLTRPEPDPPRGIRRSLGRLGLHRARGPRLHPRVAAPADPSEHPFDTHPNVQPAGRRITAGLAQPGDMNRRKRQPRAPERTGRLPESEPRERGQFTDVRGGDLPVSAWVAVAVIGLVLAGIGGVWGWQRWNDRSSPPIDDLLPMLPDVETPAASSPGTAATAESLAIGSGSGVEPRRDAPAAPDPADPELAAPDPGAPQTVAPVPTSRAEPGTAADPGPVIVHVSGAVARPGVVEVAADARVFEAVAAAGGVADDADPDRVNLAAPLVDGERIHIPRVGEDQPPELVPTDRPVPAASTPTGRGASDVTGTGPTTVGAIGAVTAPGVGVGVGDTFVLDLNRATAAELEALPGVGPAIAQAITDLRTARGPYHSVDELLLVDGIGPTKLEAIRPHAWVYGS